MFFLFLCKRSQVSKQQTEILKIQLS